MWKYGSGWKFFATKPKYILLREASCIIAQLQEGKWRNFPANLPKMVRGEKGEYQCFREQQLARLLSGGFPERCFTEMRTTHKMSVRGATHLAISAWRIQAVIMQYMRIRSTIVAQKTQNPPHIYVRITTYKLHGWMVLSKKYNLSTHCCLVCLTH